MGDSTGISWTDATWNPVRGCSRVSAGCQRCYAEQQAARIVRMGKGAPTAYDGLVRAVGGEPRWTGEVRLVPEHLADPLKWRKPRRIFVNSMSDLFHEKLTNEQIAAVFGVMAACPQHTFQVLTKRARRMREWFAWLRGPSEETFTMQQRDIAAAPNTARALLDAAYEYLGKGRKPELDLAWRLLDDDPWPLPNVHLGVSVENQGAHDDRAEELLNCPAAVYFFSVEPMLGPVDASQSLRRMLRTADGRLLRNDHPDSPGTAGTWRRHVDWVIAGCESGPGARPCDVAWLRLLRDQCASAGVPYFLKQAVETSDSVFDVDCEGRSHGVTCGTGSKRKAGGVIDLPYLDGALHAAFPGVAS